MKKLFVAIFILIVVGSVGFFFLNQYIYREKQAPEKPVPIEYQGTLTGIYVCLPHKDTEGPQTLECAFGLKTDGGSYYGLDFGQTQPTNISMGDRITVKGMITPVEALSAIQKYPIEGVVRVTDVSKAN
jgi:hypothetical protein